MSTYTEYFRKRLEDQHVRVNNLETKLNYDQISLSGKKRKYEEAMGYKNDYIVVQENDTIKENIGLNWKDAYLENINNK